MKIIVEHEYGWKYWVWEIDAHWNEVTDLLDEKINREHWYASSDLSLQFPEGEWTEVEWEIYKTAIDEGEYDAWCHLHQHDDSKYALAEDIEFTNGEPDPQ